MWFILFVFSKAFFAAAMPEAKSDGSMLESRRFSESLQEIFNYHIPLEKFPSKGSCNSIDDHTSHYVDSIQDVPRHIQDLECLFAAAYVPTHVPLGRVQRLATWLRDPLYFTFAGGSFNFETQCGGEVINVGLVTVPFTRLISMSTKLSMLEPGAKNLIKGHDVAKGSFYDGRGGILADFGFNSAHDCPNEGHTKRFEVHGVFPGNTNPAFLSAFNDLGRVIGVDKHDGGVLILVKTFILLKSRWETSGFYVAKAFDISIVESIDLQKIGSEVVPPFSYDYNILPPFGQLRSRLADMQS